MKVVVYPTGDGRWSVHFPDPRPDTVATAEELELLSGEREFDTSGEARRAGKQVVKIMHRLTATAEVEIVDYDPTDEGT